MFGVVVVMARFVVCVRDKYALGANLHFLDFNYNEYHNISVLIFLISHS